MSREQFSVGRRFVSFIVQSMVLKQIWMEEAEPLKSTYLEGLEAWSAPAGSSTEKGLTRQLLKGLLCFPRLPYPSSCDCIIDHKGSSVTGHIYMTRTYT